MCHATDTGPAVPLLGDAPPHGPVAGGADGAWLLVPRPVPWALGGGVAGCHLEGLVGNLCLCSRLSEDQPASVALSLGRQGKVP